LKADSSRVDTVAGIVDDHSATLSVQADQIASKVEASYVEGAIGDLEIGGRNYFVIAEAMEDKILSWSNGRVAGEVGSLLSGYIECSVGDKFSCNYQIDQLMFYNADQEYVGALSYQDNFIVPDENYNYPYGPSTLPTDKVPAFFRIVFRSDFLNGRPKEDVRVMLAKGDKATDWTPAPEDVQADIDVVLNYAESEITQLADEIELRVEKNGVISAINLTSESATIEADKINLVGAVTVLSDITGNLGAINAGTINGVNINGSSFNQTGSNGSITIDANGFVFDGANSSIEMNVEQTSGYHGDVASLVFKDNNNNRALEIYQYYTDSIIASDRGLILRSGDLGMGLDASDYYSRFGEPGVQLSGGLEILTGNFSLNGQITSHLTMDGAHYVRTNVIDHNGSGTHLYIRPMPGGEVKATEIGTTSSWVRVTGKDFYSASSRSIKNNIELLDFNALDKITATPVYSYYYNNDGPDDKKSIGLILEESPAEIAGEEAINHYGMMSLLWKGEQELLSITDDHADRINYLEQENQVLKQKVAKLEEGL
ncbi:endosialidase-like protein, partial [Paraliobacillus ryukyuensis]